MPPGEPYSVRQPRHRSPPSLGDSLPRHRGQASSSSKDGIHEGSERLDGRGKYEHEARYAEEDDERHHPLPACLVTPQPARAIRDRGKRAAENEKSPFEFALALDHAAASGAS